MAFTAYYLAPNGELHINLTEEQVKSSYDSGEGLLWVDIVETANEDGQFLETYFKFHQLTIEDCISINIHPPKVDDFGDHIFMILHGVNYAVESEVVGTAELAVFLGRNFVVSSHSFPMLSVDSVKQMVERDGLLMRRSADFLVYSIMDALVDNVMPTVDKMTEVGEDIEEEVIRQPHQRTLEAILKLKRSAVHLHRVMAPQREVLNRMSRGDFALIREEARIYYRDIYDHIVRIEDLNQTVRDMADNALATYMSSIANKQNEVMKILSIVAAIFLPLGLITGIFGMNFTNMPELNLSWGYYAVIGFILFTILTVLGLFWRQGWINWGRKRISIPKTFLADRSKLVGNLGRSGRSKRH
ncbi:magnesium/cobalt transporter CorA [Chloroflexota bacterium]